MAKPDISIGGIYSIQGERNDYRLLKVLATDKKGVHIHLFAHACPVRPREITSEAQLEDASFNDTQDFSMGHMPLLWRSFWGYEPEFIRQDDLSAPELQGYNMWKEAKGGYF